jgi:hypothetical protein
MFEMQQTPYLLTTLDDAKRYMMRVDTNSTQDDAQILGFVRVASNTIETFLRRKIRLRTFTEELYSSNQIYGRNGMQILDLRNSPVTSISEIIINNEVPRNFDSDNALETSEYTFNKRLGQIEFGGSLSFESGFIDDTVFNNNITTGHVRNRDTIPNTDSSYTYGMENIRITYTAGYSGFDIETGVNDTIDWEDDNGTQTATISSGVYSASGLASALQTAMNAAASSPAKTVTYNQFTGKFTIAQASGTFILQLFNGANASKTIGYDLGYDSNIQASGMNHNLWGTWRIITGTANSTTWTTETFDSTTGQIVVQNIDDEGEDDLLFSFDAGANTAGDCPPAFRRNPMNFQATTISLKGIQGNRGDGDVNYQILYTVDDGALSYESNNAVLGIPYEIQDACNRLTMYLWERSGKGDLDELGKNSISSVNLGTLAFNKNEKNDILQSIVQYKEVRLG